MEGISLKALLASLGRLGGDPSSHPDFAALSDEIAKLNHPARPDVDWHKVEQCCLSLLLAQGVELQTLACITLARAQNHGLSAMADGVELIRTYLAEEWPGLWPQRTSVRLEILAWVCTQLQSSLRSLSGTAEDLPALVRLGAELDRLEETVAHRAQVVLASLREFREGITDRIGLVERQLARYEPAPPSSRRAFSAGKARDRMVPAAVTAAPVVLVVGSSPLRTEAKAKKRRVAYLGLVAAGLFGVGYGLWWDVRHGDDRFGLHRYLPVGLQRGFVAEQVRLDSQLLFGVGSAELKPDSARVLIDELVNIRARAGWLIVIAGHTDATGNEQRNLQLSRDRAGAVRDWMQRFEGIPDSCFAVQGFGASQPLSSNETAAGRAANRRVDIRLVPVAGACESS